MERLRHAIDSGPIRSLEETWVRADGESRDFSFAAARLGQEANAGIVVFVADNTEQRRAELTQHETETRFAAISANLPGVVFQMLARPAQRLLLMPFVSAGATRLFNVAPAEFLADPARFVDLLDPADRDDVFIALDYATSHGSVLEGQWQIARTDGTRRWIQLSATAREANGGNWLFDGIITDITAQKETERELTRSREELRELTAHIEALKEEERRAVAREIHDDIGGALTALKFDLAWLLRNATLPAEAATRLANAIESVNQTAIATQRVVRDLRPAVLDQGIVPALEWLTDQFAKRTGIETHFDSNRDDELDPATSITLYRVCQEALTNVTKHAEATRVDVHLFLAADQVHLEIADNGKGLISSDQAKPSSFGLAGMHERARNLNGSVDISGAADQGATVMLSLPWTRTTNSRGAI